MTIAAKRNFKRLRWSIYGTNTSVQPLIMDINPKDFAIQYTKIKNVSRTKGGFYEEHWGDDIDTISAAGKTAMWFSNRGLTVKERRDSESFGNFIKLLEIYKNNGVDYNSRLTPIKWGRIKLEYDYKTYEGYFENFTIQEMAEEPFTLAYTLSFKVVKTIGEYKVSKPLSISEIF